MLTRPVLHVLMCSIARDLLSFGASLDNFLTSYRDPSSIYCVRIYLYTHGTRVFLDNCSSWTATIHFHALSRRARISKRDSRDPFSPHYPSNLVTALAAIKLMCIVDVKSNEKSTSFNEWTKYDVQTHTVDGGPECFFFL